MTRTKKGQSETLSSLFGTMNDGEVSKKLIRKLMQYNMKYEEITKVILSHSERTFLDARLITLEEYYQELEQAKKSEVNAFLESLE
jgi:predicted CopG family antitoxin